MTPNQPQIRLFYPIWLSKNMGKTIHAYNAHPFTRFTITDQFSAKNPPSFFPLLSTYFALSESFLLLNLAARLSEIAFTNFPKGAFPPDLPLMPSI